MDPRFYAICPGISGGYREWEAFWSNIGRVWRMPKLTQFHPYCFFRVVPVIDLSVEPHR